MTMTAPDEGISVPMALDTSAATVARLLDALRTDRYQQEGFRRELQVLVNSAPEEAWTFLSLVDQQYRCGKIRSAHYRAVNSYLTALLLGSTRSASPGAPRSATVDQPRPAGHTSPVVAGAPVTAPRATCDETVPPLPDAAMSATEPDPFAMSADDMLYVGRTLRGRYRVVGVVGRGGLGTVFEAVDQYRAGPPQDQRVAMKVLHAAVCRRPALLNALVREFQHVQSLSHPNIVRVHEFDRDGETAFFTMELLTGLTLDRVLHARGRTAFDRPHALAIIGDVGAALTHAHARGIVHGDINPHNIFVTDEGSVRVLDFGSSTKARTEPWIFDVNSPESIRFATPGYASCEMLEGEAADVRDDLFGLACIAYELLTGRHPFAKRNALQARSAGIVPGRPHGLARGPWRALREGLALERGRRPANVEKWAHRLDAGNARQRLPELSALINPQPRKRAGPLVAVACVAALSIVVGGWWMMPDHDSRFIAVATTLSVGAGRILTDVGNFIATIDHSASRRIDRIDETAAVGKQALHTAGLPDVHGREVNASRSFAAAALTLPAKAERKMKRPAVPAVIKPARIEFATNIVTVPPMDPVARVVVSRSGDLRAAVSFRWRTESGSAQRDADFAVVGPHVAYIPRGRRSMELLIPIVSDPTRSRPVSFYVVIEDAGPGAQIGRRTIARITIQASR